MKKDLVGQRFGRLVVVEETEKRCVRQIIWKCKCDCGNETFVQTGHLTSGHTKSCGCVARELSKEKARKMQPKAWKSNTTHGGSKDRLYAVWRGILTRCEDKNCEAYKWYGGIGIKLCSEWHNYSSFRAWAISNGYDASAKRMECTIDRIDVNGDYSPENCRWVDISTQCNNRRSNRNFAYGGVVRNIKEWSDVSGIPYGTLRSRLLKYGWTIDNALNTPLRGARKRTHDRA